MQCIFYCHQLFKVSVVSTETLSVYQRYPRLLNLKGKVPDEIVEREVNEKAVRFEEYILTAEQLIPTVRMCDVFPPEVETSRIVLENFLGQWGNVSVEELCKICLIAAWKKPASVFEFGTYNGATTLQIAMNTPENCRIVTLDVPPDSTDAAELEVGEIDHFLAQKQGAFNVEVGSFFKSSPYAEKVTQIWGDSMKVDLSAYAGAMDIVYVDAGHTYPYMKSDTENALKMIAPGGIIIWHDYNQVLHPDVTLCLMEYAEQGIEVRHLRGTNLAVHYHR